MCKSGKTKQLSCRGASLGTNHPIDGIVRVKGFNAQIGTDGFCTKKAAIAAHLKQNDYTIAATLWPCCGPAEMILVYNALNLAHTDLPASSCSQCLGTT
jgi:hypothetical protein